MQTGPKGGREIASGLWIRPLIGVEPELRDALDRHFPRDGKRGRPCRPSLRNVVLGWYMRCFREQGLTSTEASRWLLHIAARFDPSRVTPLDESALKRCERALQRLEHAAGAPIAPGRNPAAGSSAYHHAERARRACQARHDELLKRLDCDGAWNDRDYQRTLIELGTRSIDALSKQSACASTPEFAEQLRLQAEAWPEPIAKAEARLAELDRIASDVRRQSMLDGLGGLTTQDIARLPERERERRLRELDPGWAGLVATPGSDALLRRSGQHMDADVLERHERAKRARPRGHGPDG